MFQRHRVEIITFAVALMASIATLAWLERGQIERSLFGGAGREIEIRHKDSGEVLMKGYSRLQMVIQYASSLRKKAKQLENGEAAGASMGGRGPRPDDAGAGPMLNGAELSRINLSNADLSGLVIQDGRCAGTDFRESLVLDADLAGTDFSGANFGNTSLDRSNLSDTDLRGAQLIAANAKGVSFRSADLTEADVSSADLTGADFTGADLADLVYNKTTRLVGAKLGGAKNVSAEFRAFAVGAGAIFEDAVPNVGQSPEPPA